VRPASPPAIAGKPQIDDRRFVLEAGADSRRKNEFGSDAITTALNVGASAEIIAALRGKKR
jgi:hypothetical protein